MFTVFFTLGFCSPLVRFLVSDTLSLLWRLFVTPLITTYSIRNIYICCFVFTLRVFSRLVRFLVSQGF